MQHYPCKMWYLNEMHSEVHIVPLVGKNSALEFKMIYLIDQPKLFTGITLLLLFLFVILDTWIIHRNAYLAKSLSKQVALL